MQSSLFDLNTTAINSLRQDCLSTFKHADSIGKTNHLEYVTRILEDLNPTAAYMDTIGLRNVTNFGTARFGPDDYRYYFFRELGEAFHKYDLGCSTGGGPSSMRAVPEGLILAHLESQGFKDEISLQKLRDCSLTAKEIADLDSTLPFRLVPSNVYGIGLDFPGEPPHPFDFGIDLNEFTLRIPGLLCADAFTMLPGGAGSIQEILRALNQMEIFSTEENNYECHRPLVIALPEGSPMHKPLEDFLLRSNFLSPKTNEMIYFTSDPNDAASHINNWLSKPQNKPQRVKLQQYVDHHKLAEQLGPFTSRTSIGSLNKHQELFSRATTAINTIAIDRPELLPLVAGILVDSTQVMEKLSSVEDFQTTILHEGKIEGLAPPHVRCIPLDTFNFSAPMLANDMLLKFTDHSYLEKDGLSQADMAFTKIVNSQTGFGQIGKTYSPLKSQYLIKGMIEEGTISPHDYSLSAQPDNVVNRVARTDIRLTGCKRSELGGSTLTFRVTPGTDTLPLSNLPGVSGIRHGEEKDTIFVDCAHRTNPGEALAAATILNRETRQAQQSGI